MEELINMLKEKVGLDDEQGASAASAVMEWLKEKLPAGIGEQVTGLLEGGGDTAGDLMDKAKDALGGFLGGMD